MSMKIYIKTLGWFVLSPQQRRLECARNRLLALARQNGIADRDDGLSGPRHLLEALGGSLACLVVEPVAKRRMREQLGEPGPAAGAPIEHTRCDRTEAVAILRAGRDHNAIEGCQQLPLTSDIGPKGELDA